MGARMPSLRQRAGITLEQDSLGRPLQIVVLAVFHRPHEGSEPDQAEPNRNRDEEEEVDHSAAPAGDVWINPAGRDSGRRPPAGPREPRRSAFATTMMDDSDIATAATSGVTRPSTATGLAT